MRRVVRARSLITLVGLTLLIGLVGAGPASASTQLTATTSTAIRSSASPTATILGTVDRGQTVTSTRMGKGWATIRFAGGRGYLSKAALTTRSGIAVASVVAPGSVRVASTGLNVRTGPATSYPITTVIADGGAVTLTGTTSKGFAKLVVGRGTGWASLRYLVRIRGRLPAVVGERVATTALNIRTSSGADSRTVSEVKKGTVLSVTGVVRNGRAQVVYRGASRWVTAKYLKDRATTLPAPPGLPEVTGYRYATTVLNIRSTYTDDYALIAEVPTGTKLAITGTVKNGRMRIIWDKSVRWVTAKYLSKAPPAAAPPPGGSYAVEKGLKPNAVKVHRALMARYPQITTYYGVRPDPIPDHPSGRALDVIIPNYRSTSGKALGYEVAGWLKDHATELGIQYLIWNQHIWNIQRDSEGWRYMADRGGDSANHKNHVHVTVYG